jgi:UDP-N-acetylmuramate dehydrogenase
MPTVKEIADSVKVECLENVSASTLNTFRTGGIIKHLLLPRDAAQFAAIVFALSREKLKPFILGGGSNTVICDGIVNTPVISTRRLDRIMFDGHYVQAEAGVRVSSLIAEARKHGLGGMEFLAGVPCTVGGIVRGNAGAFGFETADYVDKVKVLNPYYAGCGRGLLSEYAHTRDVFVQRDKKDCDFSYRRGVQDIIVSAVFKMNRVLKSAAEKKAWDYMAKRGVKQPRLPSCGSVFKNGEQPAGLLIDRCGIKGVKCGGAEISELNGNFIVNRGGATTGDFLCLVEKAEAEVEKKYGFKPEREFVLLDC